MSGQALPPSLGDIARGPRGGDSARREPIDTSGPCKIQADHLNFYYGDTRALQDISVSITANVVTAFIGPSGCGKSTFLRTLNRMNDIIPGTRVDGRILIDEHDIYGPGVDVVALRRREDSVRRPARAVPCS